MAFKDTNINTLVAFPNDVHETGFAWPLARAGKYQNESSAAAARPITLACMLCKPRC